MKRLALLGVLALTTTGCGGGTGIVPPTIPAARIYRIVGFQPAGAVTPGSR